MRSGSPWPLGGHLYALAGFYQHVPKALIGYTLLVAGHGEAQRTYLTAYTQALIVTLSFELIWGARVRTHIAWRKIAYCLLLSTAFGAVVTILAFSDLLNDSTGFWLLTCQLALGIPANDARARWRLQQTRNPCLLYTSPSPRDS